jgi:hypothetical protein
MPRNHIEGPQRPSRPKKDKTYVITDNGALGVVLGAFMAYAMLVIFITKTLGI